MVQEFDHAKDGDASERGFQAWRKAHPRGYVINRAGKTLMLHFADCWHFHDEPAGVNNTKKPKICSTDRVELENWAREHGVEGLVDCKTCKLG